ncbi:TonB-dependent siderophore receptor [Hyphomicrobium sp. MC8b]|uniref:TonB-dependent siderophore receptor n=1 Tax=Hyphomicrobium sp. MC8b TaxID=300273 RepID=UPI00391ACB2C
MSRSKYVGVAASVVFSSVASSSPIFAQTAETDPSAAAGSPSVGTPDSPPSDSPPTPDVLPSMVVEGKVQKKKVSKAKAKAKPVQAVTTSQPSTAPKPAGIINSRAGRNTPYGPVTDYLAAATETGMKTDTPLNEIPQSISVVGAEQIRDQDAQSVQDALRYVPGVVADGYGLDSRTDGPIIRGSTEVPEYLDGLRRTFGYYTYNYRLEPYFLERIEVLRGPASVLYGQAAVGGIINSVSKRPQSETAGEIGVQYGSFDFKQVNFDLTGPMTTDGKWSYRLTGVARDADTQVKYVPNDRYALAPAISYRPDNNTTITVIGDFQRDRTGSTAQFFPHIGTIFPNVNGKRITWDTFAGEPGDHYDTDAMAGTVLVEHKFNSWLKLQHASRYADIHNDYSAVAVNWDYLDAAQEELSRYRWMSITDTQVFNQDTNLEAKFGTGPLEHKVLAGIDFTHFHATQGWDYAYDANPDFSQRPFNIYHPVYGDANWVGSSCAGQSYAFTAAPKTPACDRQSVVQTGLYGQDQIRLGNWLAVLGLRHDWVDNTTNGSSQADEATTYRAGLMYEFSNGFTPYFSYAESFIPVVGFARTGAAFNPQEGRQYEVGFKYQPVGSYFSINSAIYDINDTGRLVADPINPNYSAQIGEAEVKGFEIELVGRLTKNLKSVLGYSYTQAEYAGDYEYAGNQIESIPKNVASLWAVWDFDQPGLKGWSMGGGVRYIGASWDETNTIQVPDVTLFDAMIAYETEHWRWQLNGKNLENKLYYSTCLARGDCFIGEARTITTSLTYKY